MAAKDDVVFEAQEEVLSRRLDREEAPPVQPLGDALHRGARVRRLHLDAFPDERLQALGSTRQ